jgi:hypothetical protein
MGPIVSGYQPLDFCEWPILLSIAITSFYFHHGRKQGIHLRVFIMQLSSTKFLYLSAHPLLKVRLQRGSLEKVMHSVIALLGRGKVSLGEECCPPRAP